MIWIRWQFVIINRYNSIQHYQIRWLDISHSWQWASLRMGGSRESQTRGWLHTSVGFSSEASPDTHKEHHGSHENTSPLSWWWREVKPPRTHLRLFSKNGGFVCREKSHETVGWGHWWKSHWWWRQKRKTQLEMGQVRGRPTMNPGWAGRCKWHGGQTSIQISSWLCTELPLLKAAHRGVLMPNNWKKKKLQFVLYNISTSQQNFVKYDGCQENTQSEDT